MFARQSNSVQVSRRSTWSGTLGLLTIIASVPLASAATISVNQNGTAQFRTITAAIQTAKAGDTIQVFPGIYNESVTISVPVTLIGAGRDRTIINALGQPNGVLIDGFGKDAPAPGIANVTVSGFTVENANLEGILIRNATGVTITDNQITANNKALKAADSLTCEGLPAFETNENEDCGEGLHLMAVDHSIVANNIVKNNAGGILITDETGASHDNLIHGNSVSDNSYDCGITMASHKPYTAGGIMASGGVYHNTVSGNTSSRNGTKPPGGGAGVGIFAPGPGNKAWGNIVINNTLMGNGQPGVAMHNHAAPQGAPAANLNDNMILGNRISGNAADDGDAATAGTTGISIFSRVPVSGTIIAQNVFTNEQIGIAVNVPSGDVSAQLNNFQVSTGVDNLGSGTINATQNYWGCPAGVGKSGCSGVIGTVSSGDPATQPFVPNPESQRF